MLTNRDQLYQQLNAAYQCVSHAADLVSGLRPAVKNVYGLVGSMAASRITASLSQALLEIDALSDSLEVIPEMEEVHLHCTDK